MAEIKDNELIITDENGNKHLMEILFTYEHGERGKKYVFFFDPSDEENVMAMIYTDDGELFEIEDDEEYEEVEEVFGAFIEEQEKSTK